MIFEDIQWPTLSEGKFVEATELMEKYRQCVLTLWNQHYINIEADIWDVIDAYRDIRSKILEDFIRLGCGKSGKVYAQIRGDLSPNSVLVGRSITPQYTRWDFLETNELYKDILFEFVDFFDWDVRSFLYLYNVELIETKTVEPKLPLVADFMHCRFAVLIKD